MNNAFPFVEAGGEKKPKWIINGLNAIRVHGRGGVDEGVRERQLLPTRTPAHKAAVEGGGGGRGPCGSVS